MANPITQFGVLIDPTTPPPRRDAVHIAVAPAFCLTPLLPGDHVAPSPAVLQPLNDGSIEVERTRYADGTWVVATTAKDGAIGIVDPFLTEAVPINRLFWIFLYQDTITDLSHAWEHPAFPAFTGSIAPINSKEQAKAWVELAASYIGMDYDTLISAATRYVLHDDHEHMGNDRRYSNLNQDAWRTFWGHYETLSGYKLPDSSWGGAPFSCSC